MDTVFLTTSKLYSLLLKTRYHLKSLLPHKLEKNNDNYDEIYISHNKYILRHKKYFNLTLLKRYYKANINTWTFSLLLYDSTNSITVK